MRTHWREVTIEDLKAPGENALATGPFGSSISAQFFRAEGVPVIRGSNLSEDVTKRLVEDDYVFVTPQKAQEFRRSVVRRGDLVFTCWGTIGQVGLIDERSQFEQYVISNKQMKLTPDPSLADSLFLYYALSQPSVQDEIRGQSIGSSVPGFNLGQLRKLRVLLPPLGEQRAIAQVLGGLDDKIELNRRTNETLEAMARALFKSWFVDFDPVRAKAEGRLPSGMDAATAALFPASFVATHAGDVPEGWQVVPLDKIATFRNGLALQRFRPSEGEPRLPVVKIAQLRSGIPESGEWATVGIDPGCVLSDGDVVFSWSGSLIVRVWTGGTAALNQHLFRVTSERFPKWLYLQWLLHHLPVFQRTAGDKATTMGHIQRHHLTDALCLVPPIRLLDRMTAQLEPILEKQIQLALEARKLQQIRDLLLPTLLSGALAVESLKADVLAR